MRTEAINKTFYVVRLGGRLYITNAFYNLYPSTTYDIFNAKRFSDVDQARKVATKNNGDVVEVHLTESGESVDSEEDIEMMQETIDELERQNQRLRQQLEIFKRGRDEEI